MNNRYYQPGLGSMLQQQQQLLSQREMDTLKRQQIQAQTEAQRAKASQLRDPAYLQRQQPSAVQEYQYYQSLSPEEQKRYLGVKRATPEEMLARKGAVFNPQTGQYEAASGLGGALGSIGAAEITGKTPAEVDRQRQLEEQKVKTAKQMELKEREAMLPELEQTIEELNKLGQKATYTKAGQLKDVFAREFGQSTEGMEARTAYIAMVDNQVLPLLKQTFGAAFTVQEGERLRNTFNSI